MWWDRKRCSRQFTRALNAVPAHYFHPHNFLRVLYRSFCNVSTHSPPLHRKTGEFCRVRSIVFSQSAELTHRKSGLFLFLNIFGVFHRTCDGEIVFSRLWRSPPHAGRFCRTRRLYNKKRKAFSVCLSIRRTPPVYPIKEKKQSVSLLKRSKSKISFFRCAGTSRRRYACRF